MTFIAVRHQGVIEMFYPHFGVVMMSVFIYVDEHNHQHLAKLTEVTQTTAVSGTSQVTQPICCLNNTLAHVLISVKCLLLTRILGADLLPPGNILHSFPQRTQLKLQALNSFHGVFLAFFNIIKEKEFQIVNGLQLCSTFLIWQLLQALFNKSQHLSIHAPITDNLSTTCQASGSHIHTLTHQ